MLTSCKPNKLLRAVGVSVLAIVCSGSTPWHECEFAFPPDGITALAAALEIAAADCEFEGVSAERDVAEVSWSDGTDSLAIAVHPAGCGPDGAIEAGAVEFADVPAFRAQCGATLDNLRAPEFAARLGVVTVRTGGEIGARVTEDEATPDGVVPRARREPVAGVGTVSPDFAPLPTAWRAGFWSLAIAGWGLSRRRRR